MKKIVIIVIGLFIALIGWLYYVNLTNIDEFRLHDYAKIPTEKVVVNEPIFVSFDLNYHGNGKPILKDIRFMKKDGSYLEKDDKMIRYTAYIDEKGTTQGVITEKEAQSSNLLENYIPIENYKVEKQNIKMVIEVTIKDEQYVNDINALEIDYELLGSEKMKQIFFTGFLSED